MPAAVTPLPASHWSIPKVSAGSFAAPDFAGKVVLVVNTASMCGYTPQYRGMQALQDAYGAQGLVVLAVPSDDFHQEKATGAEVQDFCETTFGLTLPMTAISPVTGPGALPLYRWVREETGFAPAWNFAKVLIDRQGRVTGSWASDAEPMGGAVEAAVKAALAG